jgi:hypothetical protein
MNLFVHGSGFLDIDIMANSRKKCSGTPHVMPSSYSKNKKETLHSVITRKIVKFAVLSDNKTITDI